MSYADGIDNDKARRWMRMDDAKTVIERAQIKHTNAIRSLRDSRELLDIGRYQGQLEILDWFLKLREE
jgi:hypothetical protein